MLYFGVKLNSNGYKITVLSESFACLDIKYFDAKDFENLYNWADSFKYKDLEKCYWFFDEYNFNKYAAAASNFTAPGFYLDLYSSDIYLVNHRKLLNIIQFLYEWAVHTESYLTLDIDMSFLLASAFRLFDSDDFKYFKPENFSC